MSVRTETVTTTTTTQYIFEDFKAPFYGCYLDMLSCLLGTFCPCFLGSQNRANSEGREWHYCDCLCWAPCTEYYARQVLRKKYGYDESQIGDTVLTVFCLQCMICQHAREIKEIDSSKV